MRLVFLLLVTIVLAACETLRAPQSGRNDRPDEQIRALLAGADVSFDAFPAPGSSPLAVHTFSYKSEHGRTPYGYGFGVSHSESKQLLWIHLIPGDYAPHHFQWMDFDGDGRHDILLYFGEEDVFQTQVIFNRLAADRFAMTNFAVGLEIDHAYAAVVETPGDGLPSLMMPSEPRGEPELETRCLSDSGMERLREIVAPEFRRISGRFSALNADDPMPEMFLFETVRFVNLRDGWWNDVTERHFEHLRWRIDTLRTLRSAVRPECSDAFERLISDLERQTR
jgi:hypothetical protein